MDNLESLFNKKQYELIVKLTESSTVPSELLLRLSSLVLLNQDEKALDEIEKHQDIFDKNYPYKVMKLHFELLLNNHYFEEAKLMHKHYENLPYISQEVEEFLRDIPQRIEEEEHHKSQSMLSEEEIEHTLTKEKEAAKIAKVIFSLKNYNLNIYLEPLLTFLTREDVHPNFRTYALALLVDNHYDKEVNYLSTNGMLIVNPSKVEPPFMSKRFDELTKLIYQKSIQNITIKDTALHLLNCYILDMYPLDIYDTDLELLSDAFILLAKEYINEKDDSYSEDVIALKNKLKKVIESTPILTM